MLSFVPGMQHYDGILITYLKKKKWFVFEVGPAVASQFSVISGRVNGVPVRNHKCFQVFCYRNDYYCLDELEDMKTLSRYERLEQNLLQGCPAPSGNTAWNPP